MTAGDVGWFGRWCFAAGAALMGALWLVDVLVDIPGGVVAPLAAAAGVTVPRLIDRAARRAARRKESGG